jgi:CubicO group peptidase (beta-lactamase class C family)
MACQRLFIFNSPEKHTESDMNIQINIKTFVIALATFVFTAAVFAQMPSQGGAARAPDNWLFEQTGRSFWAKTQPSPSPVTLNSRQPTAAEQPIIDRVRSLMATRPARVFALVDGDTVVYSQFNSPANEDAITFGFSMGKSVTSMAVGQAVCANKLKLETKASELIPQLAGKALGTATVRDLLRMASGASDGNADSTVFTPEQERTRAQGNLNFMDAVTEDRLARAQRGMFSDYKPGEAFSYKSTDPILLGIMVAKATGMPWSQWLQENILNPMGAAKSGLYETDRQQNGSAAAGIYLRVDDWIRFGLWVKASSKESGCFGDFVRDAMKTQIKNGNAPADRKFGRLFAGYGHLIWTDNSVAPNTAWASGWGGQRIGWSSDAKNQRMVVVFSNVESWMPEVYEIMRDWSKLAKQ